MREYVCVGESGVSFALALKDDDPGRCRKVADREGRFPTMETNVSTVVLKLLASTFSPRRVTIH